MTLNKKFYKSVDFWFSIAFIAILYVFWSQIARIKADTAKVMPKIIIIASWLCCLGILLKTVLSEEKKKKANTPLQQTLVLLGVLLFTIVVLLSAKTIGMYVALFLSITAISISISYMEGKTSRKDIVYTILYDIATIVIIYLLFHVFLKVSTPKGFLL